MPIMYGYAVKYNGRYYPPNTSIDESPLPKAAGAAESVEKPNPSKDTQTADKAQQGKRAARQRGQKGKVDADA